MSSHIPSRVNSKEASSSKYYSTGVEDLDELIGGGIIRQGIYLIKRDRYAKHGKLLFDLFLSQGLAEEKAGVYMVSFDNDWKEIVKNACYYTSKENNSLPVSTTFQDKCSLEPDINLKIAWRYSSINKNVSKLSKNKLQLDLSVKPPKHFFDTCYERTAGFGKEDIKKDCSTAQSRYEHILASIKNDIFELIENKFCSSVRICIDDLGSFSWPKDEFIDSKKHKHISYFLWGLQSILRTCPFACACVTIPTHYYSPLLLSNAVLFSTVSLSLISFLDDCQACYSHYSEAYDGLLVIERGRKRGWESLGYKVRKNNFSIKTLSIPLDESTEASRVGSTPRQTLNTPQELF